MKKILLGAAAVVVVGLGALLIWVNAVLGTDAVRTALAGQLSSALGQPVQVGRISATIYPRVSVSLGDLAIGQPARIRAKTLKVGASLGALLSRRIEHATVEVSDARIELPLPPFSLGAGAARSSSSDRPAVQLVSIDGIVLHGVEITSGGRTLSGEIEVLPDGTGLKLERASFSAEKTTIDVTGRISDLAGPRGDLAIKAGALDFDQLLAFANDFTHGAGAAPGSRDSATSRTSRQPTTTPVAPPMDLTVSLDAAGATMGQLALQKLSGKARITSDSLTLNPVGFGVFGGRYDGSLTFTLAAIPEFRLNATLQGVDVASAVAFAGSPGTMSGRLSGKLDLTGRGLDAASVERAARGTLRVDIVDGSITNLGLVRTIVVATSGRSDASSAGATRDEPFSRLGATLSIANGAAATSDLRLESKDVLLSAAGTIALDGSAINLPGEVQLSDDLSKQAGRDLVRYTQDQGRVTLPATITGSAAAPQVRIDVASMAKRAVTNRAHEEAQKVLSKGLGGLLKKK